MSGGYICRARHQQCELDLEVRAGRARAYAGPRAGASFSLAEARIRARAARQQLADGIDPVAAKRAAKAQAAAAAARSLTFAAAAERYFAAHEMKWHNERHRLQFLSSLRQYAFPIIGNMTVSDIGVADVLRCVEPVWNNKIVTASRVRGRIERVLDWAAVRGYRSGDNPARWKGHLAQVLPGRGAVAKVRHHPALPYSQIATFMTKLREREGIAARALEFLIRCTSRTGEVTGALWSEVDLNNATWTIPKERMKGGKEHRIPLPPVAVELLRALPREMKNNHVFIGRATAA